MKIRFQPRPGRWMVVAAILGMIIGFDPPLYAAEKNLEPVSLRTDWLPHGVHSILFIGVEKGFYKNRGLDVKIGDGSGSSATVQMVGTKVDSFGYTSGSAALTAIAKGVPVKAVGALARADAFALIVKAGSGIQTPKDLKGKTIVTSAGAFDAMLLPAFFKKAGVEADKVNIINVDTAAKLGIFLAGKADAVVQSAWFNLPILRAAGHKVQAFLWRDYGIDLPGYVLIAHATMIKEKPDLVRRFVAGSLEGFQYAFAHPDEAIASLIKNRPNAKLNPAVAKEQLLAFRQFQDTERTRGTPVGWQSAEDWDDAQKLLAGSGVLKDTIDPATYFTNSLLPGK